MRWLIRSTVFLLILVVGAGLIALAVEEFRIGAANSDLRACAAQIDRGELDAAQAALTPIDAELTTLEQHPWLPFVAAHREEARRLFLVEQQRVADARAEYATALKFVLGEVRTKLKANDAAGVVRLLVGPISGVPKDDPLRDSILRFLTRWQKETTVWRPADSNTIDRMLQDGPAWRETRLRHNPSGYRSFLERLPDSPFADEAQAWLIDAEVAEIFARKPPEFGPPHEFAAVSGYWFSVVNVNNDTPDTLTLRYSGQDSFKVVFAPREKGSIELLNGPYDVTASIDSIIVPNKIQKVRLRGGKTWLEFYHLNERQPTDFSKLTWYEQWPLKRTIPAHLR